MLWVLFSILAAFIWAGISIIDKYVLTKWVKKPGVPVIILGTVNLLAGLFVYFFHGVSRLSFLNIFLSYLAGIFYILGIIFYFKAVRIEEVSRVVPLFYLTPLFVLIFATVLLGEIFTPIKYLGIFLLVSGAILISSKNIRELKLGKAFWFMVFTSLALSINNIITKYLLNFADFWSIFSYTRIGTIFALIPVFYFNFSALISTVKKHGKKVIAVMSLSETLNVLGTLSFIIAIAFGQVTLVNALSSVQPFFVLLFTLTLSTFHPEILRERISKSIIAIKFSAIIMMFLGAIMIIW